MEELIFVKSGIEYYSEGFDKFDPDQFNENLNYLIKQRQDDINNSEDIMYLPYFEWNIKEIDGKLFIGKGSELWVEVIKKTSTILQFKDLNDKIYDNLFEYYTVNQKIEKTSKIIKSSFHRVNDSINEVLLRKYNKTN